MLGCFADSYFKETDLSRFFAEIRIIRLTFGRIFCII